MKPNILFFVLDSFRADKFFSNIKTSKTPNIDSLIKSGTYFNQTSASADGTILSLNSIFTGLFPCVTGIREVKLSLTNKNYISSLQDFGYNVYGMMPNLTSFSPLYKLCVNKNSTYNGGPPAESLFDGLGKKIIDILSSKMKEPWFYYVHISDLHWPLLVPEKYANSQYGVGKYEQVVSSVDHWIEKILECVDLKNTLLVITADHGTHIPLDDKDITNFEPTFKTSIKTGKRFMPKFTHIIGARFLIFLRNIIRNLKLKQANKNLSEYEKRSRLPYYTLSLFDESIQVPLLFAGYNISSKIISEHVRSVDIFPTIADIIKLPYDKTTHGRSLVPMFDENMLDEIPVYMHTIPYQQISSHDMVGIRTSKYKYFRGSRDSNQNVNLYDLQNDPFENFNIAKNNPQIVSELEKTLNNIITDPIEKYIHNVTTEEEEKIREELKKLGYL